MPKLTNSSIAVKLLRAKLESGQLSGNEAPKSVWESDPTFKMHSLSNFRTCYNKLRRELDIPDGELLRFSSTKVCYYDHFYDL